jgi:hypothetical protein
MPRDKHWWQRHKSCSLMCIDFRRQLQEAMVCPCFFPSKMLFVLEYVSYTVYSSSFILIPILKPIYMFHHFSSCSIIFHHCPSLFIMLHHFSSLSIIVHHVPSFSHVLSKVPLFLYLEALHHDGNFTRPPVMTILLVTAMGVPENSVMW